MSDAGMPLLVHGEVTDPEVDVFDREKVFMETVLVPLVQRFPGLKMVDGAHHNRQRGDVRPGRLRQHRCDHHGPPPIAQPQRNLPGRHPTAPLLFAGTQAGGTPPSAGARGDFWQPQVLPRHRQRTPCTAYQGDGCGCAGIYTAHAAIELYAEAFDTAGALDRLEGFASLFGADFYGLLRNRARITLRREAWHVPDELRYGGDALVPLRAGAELAWTLT